MKFEIELTRAGLPIDMEVMGVSWRRPKKGEFFLTDGSISGSRWIQVSADLYAAERLVAELKPVEPKYRPFANRYEFDPYRDNWVKNKDNGILLCRVIGYTDSLVFFNSTPDFFTYEKCFDTLVFEDGSPFGVAT